MSLSSVAPRFHTIVDDAWFAEGSCHVSGRLTRARLAPGEETGRLRSLRRTARMLLTSGTRGSVTWSLGSESWTTHTDERGYWDQAATPRSTLYPGWHDITVSPDASSPAAVLVADPRNRFGIISDIDDTLLVTDVLRKRSLLANSLTVPAEKRRCVPGMPELFTELLKQNAVPEASPVFYVSCSPRQLTDNLRRFLSSHGFPRGVLQLRRIVARRKDPQRDHARYKRERIEAVLRSFPNVKFALFGDDAESDPEIYAGLREQYPRSIDAVFVRPIHPDPARPRIPGHRDTRELLSR